MVCPRAFDGRRGTARSLAVAEGGGEVHSCVVDALGCWREGAPAVAHRRHRHRPAPPRPAAGYDVTRPAADVCPGWTGYGGAGSNSAVPFDPRPRCEKRPHAASPRERRVRTGLLPETSAYRRFPDDMRRGRPIGSGGKVQGTGGSTQVGAADLETRKLTDSSFARGCKANGVGEAGTHRCRTSGSWPRRCPACWP